MFYQGTWRTNSGKWEEAPLPVEENHLNRSLRLYSSSGSARLSAFLVFKIFAEHVWYSKKLIQQNNVTWNHCWKGLQESQCRCCLVSSGSWSVSYIQDSDPHQQTGVLSVLVQQNNQHVLPRVLFLWRYSRRNPPRCVKWLDLTKQQSQTNCRKKYRNTYPKKGVWTYVHTFELTIRLALSPVMLKLLVSCVQHWVPASERHKVTRQWWWLPAAPLAAEVRVKQNKARSYYGSFLLIARPKHLIIWRKQMKTRSCWSQEKTDSFVNLLAAEFPNTSLFSHKIGRKTIGSDCYCFRHFTSKS